MPGIERWRESWRGLGTPAVAESLYVELINRYSEAHRAYHTTQHLDECFLRLDEARHVADRTHEVELAIWFHDAVYAVRRTDNEEQSAAWAHAALAQAGLSSATSDRVHDLILTTKHDAVPTTRDAMLLVDVDLAILGAPVDRFDEYERQVRQEYSWVPEPVFRQKRREILQEFIARPHIYSTEHFRQAYERQARANLARSIEQLAW